MKRTHEKTKWRLRSIYLLFLFVPVSIIVFRMTGSSVWTFGFSILALIPISALIGEATEQLALHLGPLAGGLLSATFGNAPELLIGFLGLRHGLLEVVRGSIAGSIIGNLLLVMGMGALAGGLRYKEQTFGKPTGSLMSTMMLLAVIGLVVPAVFMDTHGKAAWSGARSLGLSASVAIILLLTYALGLLFSLKTHQFLFTGPAEDYPLPTWSLKRGVAVLLAATVLVFIQSELVVRTVEVTARKLGLTDVFIGVIVVAIVGNAAEHATAVVLAAKGRMDLCVNVAIGSSAQIALFVAPVLVLTSLRLPHPLTFVFSPLELTSVVLGVAVAHFVTLDGKTNWFEGVQLLAVYLILAAAFFFLP